ncbi:substrate-binding domain-containing protein [Yoonia sp. F2084L]|uniref:PstS family phosphate ABC transporter substrate-binding protein n=1 Tax=Yoonia sp. F2084L TaxID=2926419 RepID=UPI001FF59832|nr:substrate-binding domain-containing protein [Yoonia sp. F2084L]MCK0095016.1 substrate-binding domain-containing protein [Yoonia sp. F2084L]
MLTRIATILLCSVAPVALIAQEVELRSSDEFISVEGQIVGFNGVMVRVLTSVGEVSVPASEVVCFGAGCREIVASNTFGLTADVFQGINDGTQTATQAASDEMTIAFAVPAFATLYRTVSGAFAVASQTATDVTLGASGEIALASGDGAQTARISFAASDAEGDITVQSVSLNGTAPAAFASPSDWAGNGPFSQQMIGLDAFSVVVAPNAEISQISVNDLARIFAGEVTNWSQIGGADVNILPLQMPATSLIGSDVANLVMQPAGKEIAGNVLTMAQEAGIVASINQFPGSVSIVSTGSANPDLVVPVAGSCGVAVAPTPFNIVSGDYPLIRPIMASYAQAPATQLVTELFDFASSDVAQVLLDREGFINNTTIRQDGGTKNARLSGLLDASFDSDQRDAAAEMFQALFDAERLSATLVGGQVSGPEGAWNRAVLLDLAQALGDPALAGREIAFVGIGESTAGSAAAVAASAASAAAMQAAFALMASREIAASDVTLASYGFGDVSKVTCIDGQVAGSEYTRIEVWVR